MDGAPACSPVGGACDWDTTASAFGAHTIAWTATDPAGNTASAALAVTVDNPPAVTWIEPSDGASLSGVVALRFASDDDEGVASEVATIDGVETPLGWDTCDADAGEHLLVATALGGPQRGAVVVEDGGHPPRNAGRPA